MLDERKRATDKLWRHCNDSPDAIRATHECMADELRCVYCGVKIDPVGCNGCGRFLSTAELNDGETRCENCGR